MWKQMMPGLRMTLLLTVLTGLVYPGVGTALCQALFPSLANVSLLTRGGLAVGSSLIGQGFTRPEYFHPRPSAAGNDGYDASLSTGSNLGPTSRKLFDRVKASVAQVRKEDGVTSAVPADLVTTSASGLDPHISPAAAAMQVRRVAATRSKDAGDIERLVARCTEGRDLGFLGEPRVNVLLLNQALDREFPMH